MSLYLQFELSLGREGSSRGTCGRREGARVSNVCASAISTAPAAVDFGQRRQSAALPEYFKYSAADNLPTIIVTFH